MSAASPEPVAAVAAPTSEPVAAVAAPTSDTVPNPSEQQQQEPQSTWKSVIWRYEIKLGLCAVFSGIFNSVII